MLRLWCAVSQDGWAVLCPFPGPEALCWCTGLAEKSCLGWSWSTPYRRGLAHAFQQLYSIPGLQAEPMCDQGCAQWVESIIHDVSRKQCIYWTVQPLQARTINPINPATLGSVRLALHVQIGSTEHRQNHQDHILGLQPSSSMTHRFEEHENTVNVEEKYAKNTYMCQTLTILILLQDWQAYSWCWFLERNVY